MTKNTELNCYDEAMRYIDNAKETLKKSKYNPLKGEYRDIKYVKSAAGIAYAGIEMAAKWLIQIKLNKTPKKVDEILMYLPKIDKKSTKYFNLCYQILYRNIYCHDDSSRHSMRLGLFFAGKFMEGLHRYSEKAVYA